MTNNQLRGERKLPCERRGGKKGGEGEEEGKKLTGFDFSLKFLPLNC